MSTPAAKRRRIDAASSTLSKPFRSPFKTAPTAQGSHTIFPSPLRGTSTLKSDRCSEQTSAGLASHAIPDAARLINGHANVFRSPPVSAAILNADPDIGPLIKSQRQLEKELRELKEELDVAQQASRIEIASAKPEFGGEIDGELKILKQKWKEASRTASEELFTGVRDRINRMGGPKAFKEMQERQEEFLKAFNDVPEKKRPQYHSEDDDARETEEKEPYGYEYDEVDPETENEKEARGGNDVPEEQNGVYHVNDAKDIEC